MKKAREQGSFRLVAHRGDEKTLLAFDIKTDDSLGTIRFLVEEVI